MTESADTGCLVAIRETGDGIPPPLVADYQTAFANAAEGMALATLEGRLCLVNRAWCALLGKAGPEIIGLRLGDLLDERSTEFVHSRLPLLLTGGIPSLLRECQLRQPPAGKPVVWLSLSLGLARDGRGNPAFLILQARDITQARQVERLMLESDRRYRSIFNALSEGFIETDSRGRVIDLNEPMCRMIGLGREAIVGRSIRRYLDANSRAHMRSALAGNTASRRSFEVTLRNNQDGQVRAMQVYATVLVDERGKPAGATAIVLDVSERNQAQADLRLSEQRNRLLVESLQDGLVMVRDGRFDYVNAPFARMVGYTAGELVGSQFSVVLTDPEGLQGLHRHFQQRLAGIMMPESIELTLASRDGHEVLVHLTCAVNRTPDNGQLVIATIKDITAQRHVDSMLRTLSSAVEHSPSVVFITDVNGIIEYVNPKFTEVTGYTFAEAVGKTPALLKSGQTGAEVYKELWSALKSGQEWHGEFRNRRRDGEIYWENTSISPIRDDSGAIVRYVAIKEDITSRKESELLNWQRANFDQVTGLPNRVLFKDRLVQALHRSRRDGANVAVMFIDLDRFKAVNDTLGHEAGDTVLKEVAVRLSHCVRDSDTIARLAGDEFTAILPKPGNEKTAAAIARRILESLRRPFDVGGDRQAHIGCSIGIAIYPDDGSDAETLLHCADLAMYRAKNSGRNAYHFYTADMNIIAEARQQQENDVRKAVQERQLAVHFTPVISSDGLTICGAEAHFRWAHPVKGLLPAKDFVPVAEEVGLSIDLATLMLNRASMACAVWRDSGWPEMIALVNVSARQLSSPHFLDILEAALDASGLPPEALVLGISEKILLNNTPVVEATLRGVVERKVRMMITEFGTGSFSPQHLRRFPFAAMKVDSSLVRHLLENHDDALLVEAVVAMADKLGLAALAEGITDKAQIAQLRQRHPNLFARYLLQEVLPAGELTSRLEQNPS